MLEVWTAAAGPQHSMAFYSYCNLQQPADRAVTAKPLSGCNSQDGPQGPSATTSSATKVVSMHTATPRHGRDNTMLTCRRKQQQGCAPLADELSLQSASGARARPTESESANGCSKLLCCTSLTHAAHAADNKLLPYWHTQLETEASAVA